MEVVDDFDWKDSARFFKGIDEGAGIFILKFFF